MTADRTSPRQILRPAVVLLALPLAGCHDVCPPATQPASVYAALLLTEPTPNATLDAQPVPPLGWKPDPLKQSAHHVHQVWISPDGRTAYGIIHFQLPLPIGPDLALWGFMNQMRQTEGEATLLSRRRDEARDGICFIAEGGLYKIRGDLFVRGTSGWVVYAGTLRAWPVNESDLQITEAARDETLIGRAD